ncbi:MBL fold metallo-hydrolase [Sulfolobus sp. A20]|uniref:MBL fold metallo-hydrolase n=1 Tax=Sulfolobaceae TaxID=118883 RepID=UPI000845E72F|nr:MULTISPECIES: MBL fold metallo-hydrolase [unclassified Sulfolobus]TRM75304.1 MBL fold metallo-hydrolase [Sulfolobus sp. E5]TRM77694.1 MBL fold metallo-hydrolase [Sulfolobus sp. A20-N-F8]TRM81924.1 MBL fold metallo-hydrolase [Sulfolobus sp. D5]TRN00992.1 MBL fold metallo-hydrolase [Sulfolobus sp. F1]TRN03390.1 MBL fold metallo-hydrolase [Sulfolobus sp. E1]
MVKLNDYVRVLELVEPNFFGRILNHNVVIIDKGPNGGLMMIDTSLPENLDNVEKYLGSWGFSIADVSDIVLTHFHPDHFANAMEIKKIAKAKIYAHELEELTILNDVNYNEVKQEFNVSEEEFKLTMKRINSMHYKIPEIDVHLKGGEELGRFKVIHTPGHTKGHIVLYNKEVLIAGDAIRNYNGLKPPIKFFSWNYEKAIEYFNYLLNLEYKYLVPYHGEVISKC